MSIWGTILVAAAAGAALGGPLGGLLKGLGQQALAGLRQAAGGEGVADDERAATRRIAFTIAVIALSAKMAKADGVVVRSEINAFRQVFEAREDEIENVRRIFDLAKQEASGFEPYARQVAELFDPGSPVLEDLLDGLFYIAKADGAVTEPELDYLRSVANIFGLDDIAFARLRAEHVGPDQSDPHAILGVPHDADQETIRAAWLKLAREHHPDRLQAEGLPAEFVHVASEKLKIINAAYEALRKERVVG